MASPPKGGGALAPIGEKLEVAVATGTAGYTIPLAIPAGRGGFGPALALRYDSGLGNGPFGLGWELSLPSIARSTSRGVPRYRDDDVLLVAGAEDLVPWAEQRRVTETHVVDRYRPRVEGAFARIERMTPHAGGATWWEIRTVENVRNVYGGNPGARVADPEAPSQRVFAWLLERSEDDRGNVIQYEYVDEDLRGVDATRPAEAARVGRPQPQRYLKRVRYANRIMGAPDDFCFEVVFDYGDHSVDAPAPDPDVTWPARRDAFSRGRCGFDLRSYRLCRRVLVFHRFPELGDAPLLVGSDDLAYDERPTGARLVGVTRRGWVREQGGAYRSAAFPPLSLEYTDARLEATARELPAESLEDLPGGLSRGGARWIDLDGEGLSGVLAVEQGSWRYKPNLGDGRLGASDAVSALPALAATPRAALVDLQGDGRPDLVQWRPVAGVHARSADGSWQPYQPIATAPNTAGDDRLRPVDLTGDGLPDVVEWTGHGLLWHRSRGRDGFDEPEQCALPFDERAAPVLAFDDPARAVFFADMTGDGLDDLVRVCAGEVAYWPNLGHGRFGPRVVMATPPDFGADFDPRRLRIADLDGTGPSDLVYLSAMGARLYFNQSGNGWSEATVIDACAEATPGAAVSVLDLLGNGTACLIWESTASDGAGVAVRYVDLFGGHKPNLLARIDNHAGGETRIRYAPSTRFYLEDKLAGRPWATRIPFPVHVVDRVERLDRLSGTGSTSSYRYRHGYFDGDEREFRGFGCVEQRDAEAFGPTSDPLDTPPVITRSWFHTGVWMGREGISKAMADEYWRGDPDGFALPDTSLPDGLTADEERDACRTLRGSLLRREVYAEDGAPESAHPYSVVEVSFAVRRLQARSGEQPAVFHAWERERIDAEHERDPADPRVRHTLAIEVDDHGVVRRHAEVVYPRRAPEGPEQASGVAFVHEHDVAHDVGSPDRHRVAVPLETRSWHLEQLPLGAGALATIEQLGAWSQRRLLDHRRFLYWADDLSGPLPHGAIGARALACRSYTLALSHEQVAAYQGRVDGVSLAEGGYVTADGAGGALPGGWWAPSGVDVPDASAFYLPRAHRDPFGHEHVSHHDAHALFVVAAVDPVGNRERVEIDYRTLQPWWIEDANGDRRAVAFDDRGVVSRSALLGKDPSLDDPQRGDTLEEPSERIEYDVTAWDERAAPMRVRVLTRERHGDPGSPWHERITYFDGHGRELLVKVNAEPAPDGAPRWVGTGRVVVNNKGLPVKSFEPYFSDTAEYESEAALREQGVTSLRRYDPLGRLTRVDHPDGTFSRTELHPWRLVSFDRADTVRDSAWLTRRTALGGADERAARASEAHHGTPTVSHVDVQGRVYRVVEDGGDAGKLVTRTRFDVEGRPVALIDARDVTAATADFDMLGRPLRQWSNDSGERWRFDAADGAPFLSWDGFGRLLRGEHDPLRRPTRAWIDGELTELVEYGEPAAGDEAADREARRNGRRGRLVRHRDASGVREIRRYDFHGLVVDSSRRLARPPEVWPTEAIASPSSLEPEEHVETTSYDALGRPIEMTLVDGTVLTPTYSEAGLIRDIVGRVAGGDEVRFVDHVEYDARGRRTRIRYGNGAETRYTYDPLELRLVGQRTERPGGEVVQDTRYVHDAVGNVVEIVDHAQPVVFHDGQRVESGLRCRYDAIYRLVEAAGREHAGTHQPGHLDLDPHDWQQVRNYNEHYRYDPVGNLIEVAHRYALAGSPQGWTRRYAYDAGSNRLAATSVPGDDERTLSARYQHDLHGNVISMPHLARAEWTHGDRLARADLGGGGDVICVYDAGGHRVRKLRRHLGGLIEEHIYLGGVELYRRRRGDVIELERRTLHVLDDERRVALVETRTIDADDPVGVGVPRIRYQIDDRNGSASIELDETGLVISREEYHPFGTTALRLAAGQAEVSRKRYRYLGAERDEETGFYNLGARHYAPWLGRFTSADPAGTIDGANLYAYARNNPVTLVDTSGRAGGNPFTPEQRRIWRQWEKAVDSLIRATKTELAKVHSQIHLAWKQATRTVRTIVDTLETTPGRPAARFDAKSSPTAGLTKNQVASNARTRFDWRSKGPAQGTKIQASPIRVVHPGNTAQFTTDRLRAAGVAADISENAKLTKQLQPAVADLRKWHSSRVAAGLARNGMPRAPVTVPRPALPRPGGGGGAGAGLGAVSVMLGVAAADDRINEVEAAGYKISTDDKLLMVGEEILLNLIPFPLAAIVPGRMFVSNEELAYHSSRLVRENNWDFHKAATEFLPVVDSTTTELRAGPYLIMTRNDEIVESAPDVEVIESEPYQEPDIGPLPSD